MLLACIREDRGEMARIWETSQNQADLAAGLAAMAASSLLRLAHAHGDTPADVVSMLEAES